MNTVRALAAVVMLMFLYGCASMPTDTDQGIQYPFETKQAVMPSIEDTAPGEAFEVDLAFYAAVIQDMRENLELYEGRLVSIDGFIFRHDNFSPEQFLVGRLLVDCCVTDALYTSIFTVYEGGEIFKQDSWVRVTGTVASVFYEDPWTGDSYTAPKLEAVEVRQIEKPLVQYIY